MQGVVGAALRQRVLVIILSLALIVGGLFAYKKLNIEAYPDPVPPLVDIVTQNSGQSSEEIERYITIPIEVQMAGMPYVTSVRSISLTGLSDVKVQFTYDFTYREAAQLVINRLNQLAALPNGAQPDLSPTSPIGEIYRYRVVGPPGYQRHRPQDHPGLDPGAPLQGGPRRDRRHRPGAARPRPTTSPSISTGCWPTASR